MSVASSTWGASQRFRVKPASAKAEQVKGVLFYYLLALLFVAFFCSLFYIWSRIQIVNLGYSINREIILKEQLQEEHKRLSLEVASLKSPIRLENMAKNELKMDLPEKSQILAVSSNVLESGKRELKVDSKKSALPEEFFEKKKIASLSKKVLGLQNKQKSVIAKTSSKLKTESKLSSKPIEKSAVKNVALQNKKEVKASKELATKSLSKDSKTKAVLKKVVQVNKSVPAASIKKAATISEKKNQKIASIAGITPHR